MIPSDQNTIFEAPMLEINKFNKMLSKKVVLKKYYCKLNHKPKLTVLDWSSLG